MKGTGWVALVMSLLAAGCGGEPAAEPASEAVFREAAEETGLRFQHVTGATGSFFLPEIMGAGAAVFDYDNDGDLDVYFVQGAPLGRKTAADSGSRLFRNELIPEGRLRFTDVTEAAGAGFTGYGMGAATGDFDGDGNLDLYVTAFGPNVLYRNNGNGTFTDVTHHAGVADPRWSASAAFVDYDRDGNLDLFVTNYVDFTIRGNVACFDPTGARDYCNPSVYRPLPDRLYRNEGGGRFTDVTVPAGIGAAFGRGLGVTCADFDQDGWPDILVANDGTENQLWINQRNGTFRDMALPAGVAYNADGAVQAGMGVTAGDFDHDGDEDVFISHLIRETHTLFLNEGNGQFHDATISYGLATPRYFGTGFGTGWFDFDNDGWLDLFVANGAVTVEEKQRGTDHPYRQRNQIFRNDDGRGFQDFSLAAGPVLGMEEVGRGAAFGDIDRDGDIDILVTNNNGPVRLFLNEAGGRRHWLLVRLEGPAQGAQVALKRRGLPQLRRRSHTDGSYLSASDGRVHFGLGEGEPTLEAIVVDWPDGRTERWMQTGADREVVLQRGSGTAGR